MDLWHVQHLIAVTPWTLGKERNLLEKIAHGVLVLDSRELVPFLTFRHAHQLLPFGHLCRVHQAAVIVLVACNWRAPTLDRISQKANRAVVVNGVKCVRHCLHAIATQVFHQLGQFVIIASVDQLRHVALIAKTVQQTLAPCRTAHKGQRRVKLVWAVVDPLAQRVTPRLLKGGALQMAIFDAHHIPAEGLEYFFDAFEQTLTHYTVK